MALERQTAASGFFGGVDTRTDGFHVPAARLAECENAVYSSPGSLRKRDGFAARSMHSASAGVRTRMTGAGRMLASYGSAGSSGGELLMADATTLRSLDGESGDWVPKGSLTSCVVTRQRVCRDTYAQSAQDGATDPATGNQAYVWEDSAGGVRYAVVDGATGQVIVPSAALGASGKKPKVFAVGTMFVFVWYKTTDTKLWMATVPAANPTQAPSASAVTAAATNVSSVHTSKPNWDGCAFDGKLWIAFANDATPSGVTVRKYSALGFVNYEQQVDLPASANAKVLNIFGDGFRRGPVVCWWDSTDVKYAALEPMLRKLLAPVNGTHTSEEPAGSLPAGVYWYRVSATNTFGETLASTETSVTAGGVTNTVHVVWNAVAGATGYKVYGRTQGAELLMATVGAVTTWADNGTVTPSGALPSVNSAVCFYATGNVEASVSSVESITGASRDDAAVDFAIFYGRSAASTWNHLTHAKKITGASYSVADIGSSAVLLLSVAPAGKAFARGGVAYVPLVHESPLQPTYFAADETGRVVAKLLAGLGGGIGQIASDGAKCLPESCLVGTDGRRIALLERKNLFSSDGTLYTQLGVTAVTLDFADAQDACLRAEAAGALHVGGGFLQMYDGVSIVEHGFHLWPENVTGSLASGGALSAGTYSWKVCWEWLDAQGNLHRSAPSPALQKTGVTAMQKCTLTIPTLRLTAKTGTRSPVSVAVYRTEAAGTVYHRVSSATAPTANDPAADTVTFADDTVTDAALVGNPQLYTEGGVLENIAPGPVTSLAVHRSRLMALDSCEPLRVWCSKQTPPGVPAEFNDALVVNCDPAGGPITAVASLDDKLILFKSDRIYMVTGEGPDSTGAQDDFSDPILVTTDCGCVNARSVVATPAGLMFQTRKGIWLLDRGLSASYVGADVQAYNGETVTAASSLPHVSQVRFCLASGVALAYDTLVRQWSVFRPVRAVDAVSHGGTWSYLRDDCQVFTESAGTHLDGGTPVRMRVVTGWYQFAGLQGFQRVWKALLLGRFRSPHKLRVRVGYDYSDAWAQDDLFEPEAPGTWGSDATWGEDGTTWGGAGTAYQYRVFPNRQSCQALRLCVEDVVESDGADGGEGCQLASLAFEVGVRTGLGRVPDSRSAG